MAMKRDLKLCQEILQTLERDESTKLTDAVFYHLLILEDAGFVKLVNSHISYIRERGGDLKPHMARLTWHGHDALIRLRHDAYTGGSSGENRLAWVFGVNQK